MENKTFILKFIIILSCSWQILSTPQVNCADLSTSVIASSIYERATTTQKVPPKVYFNTESATLEYFAELGEDDLLEVPGVEIILQVSGSTTSRGHYNNDDGTWKWNPPLTITQDDCEEEDTSNGIYQCTLVAYTVVNCAENGARGNLVNIFDKQTFSVYLIFSFSDTTTFSQSSNFFSEVIIRTSPCPESLNTSTTPDCFITEIISIDGIAIVNYSRSGQTIRFGDFMRITLTVGVSGPDSGDLDFTYIEDDILDSIDYTVSYDGTSDEVLLSVYDGSNTFSRVVPIVVIDSGSSVPGLKFEVFMNMTGGVYDLSQSDEFILDSTLVDIYIQFTFSIVFDGYNQIRRRHLQNSDSQSITKDYSIRIENFDRDSLNEFLNEIRQNLNLDQLDNSDNDDSQTKDDKTTTIILATVLTSVGIIAIVITLVCLLKKRKDIGKPVNCESEVRTSKGRDMTENRVQDASEQI